MKKYTKWLALAMTLSMPVAIGVVAAQPAYAAQEEVAEDTLFLQYKNKIASELAASGVISKQNAEIIKNATVKKSRKISIDVNYSDGKLSFKSSPAVMERIQKNYPNNKTRVAEEYLLEVAEAVGEADMWLRMRGNGNVSAGVFSDWSNCVEVSVKNLLLKKNISEEEATASLMSYGGLLTLMKYVEWNHEKNVFILKEGLFAKDFGLATNAVADKGGDHEAATDADYSSISEDMRTFWQNLKPLENKQDLEALGKITSEMNRKTYLAAEITDVVQGEVIPFENLTSAQAVEVSKGNVCYNATTATVQISPEYVSFFNNVIVPKLCEFLTPLAKDISRKDIQVTVCRGEYKNWDQTHGNAVLQANEATYLSFPNNTSMIKQGCYNVYLARFKDINAVYSAQNNTSVDAELIVFHLPETYSRFCKVFTNPERVWDVHHHYQDINDKWIFSGRHVRVTFSQEWYNGKFAYRGINLGGFYVGKDSNFKNCVVTFNDKNEQYPYIEEEKKAQEQKEEAELKRDALSRYLFFTFIMLCIFGGMSGYGIHVLYKEYKRRWKELALPEGVTVNLVDEDLLRPEFSAFYEWKKMLVLKSEDGNVVEEDSEEDSVPYITDKKTVDTGYDVLYKLAALPDLNEHEMTTLNLMGQDLNNAQKRYLGTSKCLLAAFTICYLLFAIFNSAVPYDIGAWLGILSSIAFAIALASIFIADLMPTYKFANEEPILIRGARRVLSTIGAGTWATAIFLATHNSDTLYKDNHGNVYVEKNVEGKTMGCVMAVVVLHILLLLLPFIAFGNSVASFYRNYFSNK